MISNRRLRECKETLRSHADHLLSRVGGHQVFVYWRFFFYLLYTDCFLKAIGRILHPNVLKHISLFLLLGGVLMSMYSTQGSAATLASLFILITMFSFYLCIFLRLKESRRPL